MLQDVIGSKTALFADGVQTVLRGQENRTRRVVLLQGNLVQNARSEGRGICARVNRNGTYGFASIAEYSPEAAERVIRAATENAVFLAKHSDRNIALPPSPGRGTLPLNRGIEDVEQKVFRLADSNLATQVYTMADVVPQTIKLIDDRYKKGDAFSGIQSGFDKLDRMTSGFQNSEMIIIGARPSMGKTAMALSMMENISVINKIPCGFFSLEMSAQQIGQRLLSQVASIPGSKLRSGLLKIEDFRKLQDAAGRCYDAPLYIVDTPNMKLLDLRAMARRMRVNQKVEIIFIDYIGLITSENEDAPVYEQQSAISKSLKSLARELEIPIVVLCQVARSAEGNEPSLAELRGSGSIEQDADMVMFIHGDRQKQVDEGDYNPVLDRKIVVAKQRNGPIGDVEVLFLSSYTKFVNKKSENA